MGMLSRAALARAAESKMRAEIAAASGQHRPGAALRRLPPGPWPEALNVRDDSNGPSLGCDSLERLWLAAALGEMFDLNETAEGLRDAPTFGAWLDGIEAGWAGESVTFLTSGSSGAPKPCTHAIAELATEVDALAALLGGRARIVAAVPAHHIYGFLFTAMLPDRLGVPVAAYGDGELRPGDLLISFPDHWRLVARSHRTFPPDVTGVTSTAPCPGELIEDLAGRGLARFVEVYGSSETAGIGTRVYPAEAYTLMPHWDFREDGEGSLLHRHSGRAAAAPDRLQRVGEREFTVASRLDGVVQVGGVNVSPAHVAGRLREHPLVAEAAVRLMRPEEGARLKAFVVPAPAAEPEKLAEALRTWSRENLPAPERPAALAFGPALPTNAMGKLADW